MQTPVMVGAILVGLVALAALVGAARAWQQGAAARSRAVGFIVLAVASVAQLVNLVRGYSWTFSVVATVGMVAGLLMTGWGRSAGTRHHG